MLNPMSHSSDVTSVPWLCHDITPVPSILNQSPRACIAPTLCSIAWTSARNTSRRCGTTSTTQPYSATAAKVVAKLFWKVILMLEKAAILKHCRYLGYSVSQNKKIGFLIAEIYMIWHQHRSNRTIIWGFIQKRIFWYSKWRPSWKCRPSWHFDRLKFFSKKVTHREYPSQFWWL